MNKPLEITLPEWEEIIQIRRIRETWGLTDETPEEFASRVFGVKFKFHSGSPGYVGDLLILQGDALTDAPPVILTRKNGMLQVG